MDVPTTCGPTLGSRARATIGLAIGLFAAACGPTAVLSSPADPPGARADAYSPFPSAYEAQALGIADRLRAQLGGECLETRMLRVDTPAIRQVASHYANALPGWTPRPATAPGAGAFAYASGDARFAGAVMARGWRGWHALVIVTNTAWNDQSRGERARCMRK